MIQIENELPKTKRLRGKTSTTMLYEPLAQYLISYGAAEPLGGFPCADREKPRDYQTGITLQSQRAATVVPKKSV